MELESAYADAQRAYMREFESEEHVCTICQRNLLGGKFTFLTSCEHYFCTECLQDMVVTKINSGQVGHINCAEDDCRKNLNDLDVKNCGLDREMMEKYERFSV